MGFSLTSRKKIMDKTCFQDSSTQGVRLYFDRVLNFLAWHQMAVITLFNLQRKGFERRQNLNQPFPPTPFMPEGFFSEPPKTCGIKKALETEKKTSFFFTRSLFVLPWSNYKLTGFNLILKVKSRQEEEIAGLQDDLATAKAQDASCQEERTIGDK